MPTPAIFEELVELLEKTSNPLELGRHIETVKTGMRNLCDRFRVVEQSRVDDLARIAKLETLTEGERTELSSVAKDRTDLQHRVDALEHRLAALEDKPKPIAGTPAPTPAGKPTLAQSMGLSPATGAPTSPATPPA